jgi:hypothetical protein
MMSWGGFLVLPRNLRRGARCRVRQIGILDGPSPYTLDMEEKLGTRSAA